MKLSRDTFIGPWAGLPVPWTDDDKVDETRLRENVAVCCRAGIPGIYTGGTTGEFYALEYEEFQTVARVVVEDSHTHQTPSMIGVSSTHTLGAARRAAFAAEIGADAIQVALPFWMEVHDDEVVPFFEEVAASAPGLAVSVYETLRAKKALSIEQHRSIKEAVPQYMMVKSNAGTIGCTADGCRALSELVNVFVGEHEWGDLGPEGAVGCCSSMVYWNPRVVLGMWEQMKSKDWESLRESCLPVKDLLKFLGEHYGHLGLTDTAFDRMGGVAGGFLDTSLRSRKPYRSSTEKDVSDFQNWYRENFPAMLEL